MIRVIWSQEAIASHLTLTRVPTSFWRDNMRLNLTSTICIQINTDVTGTNGHCVSTSEQELTRYVTFAGFTRAVHPGCVRVWRKRSDWAPGLTAELVFFQDSKDELEQVGQGWESSRDSLTSDCVLQECLSKMPKLSPTWPCQHDCLIIYLFVCLFRGGIQSRFGLAIFLKQ